MNINSKRVFKFSGLGLVMNILEYPCARATAIASPSVADFPRPPTAVKVIVNGNVFPKMAYTNGTSLELDQLSNRFRVR